MKFRSLGEGGSDVSLMYDRKCGGSSQWIKGFVSIPKTCTICLHYQPIAQLKRERKSWVTMTLELYSTPRWHVERKWPWQKECTSFGKQSYVPLTTVLKSTTPMVVVIAAANSGFFASPEMVNCRNITGHVRKRETLLWLGLWVQSH